MYVTYEHSALYGVRHDRNVESEYMIDIEIKIVKMHNVHTLYTYDCEKLMPKTKIIHETYRIRVQCST